MKVETRQKIERQIARKAAEGLIAGGYAVAVHDGEEIALEASTDVHAERDGRLYRRAGTACGRAGSGSGNRANPFQPSGFGEGDA